MLLLRVIPIFTIFAWHNFSLIPFLDSSPSPRVHLISPLLWRLSLLLATGIAWIDNNEVLFRENVVMPFLNQYKKTVICGTIIEEITLLSHPTWFMFVKTSQDLTQIVIWHLPSTLRIESLLKAQLSHATIWYSCFLVYHLFFLSTHFVNFGHLSGSPANWLSSTHCVSYLFFSLPTYTRTANSIHHVVR